MTSLLLHAMTSAPRSSSSKNTAAPSSSNNAGAGGAMLKSASTGFKRRSGNFSRPVQRVRFCLCSQSGFLRDLSDQVVDSNTDLWTLNANKAFQFVSFDAAIKRVRMIQPVIPELFVRSVLFTYEGNNVWRPADVWQPAD